MSKDRLSKITEKGAPTKDDRRFHELIRKAISKAYEAKGEAEAPYPYLTVFVEGSFDIGYIISITTDPETFFDRFEEVPDDLGGVH